MKDSRRNYLLYLEDIQDSMAKILSFTEDLSFDEFSTDTKTQDAVIRNFEIIGEASNNLPNKIREQYPEVPWNEMYGLRNIISHQYFGIDLELIWNIITSQLPENHQQITEIIENEKS